MPDASIVAVDTPPPMHYETSRSFVARFLGMRHRVVAPPAATPEPVPDLR